LLFFCFISFFNFFFCIFSFFSMDSKYVKKWKFSHDWLEKENYNSWIREVSNDNLYFCVFFVFNKTFSCSSRIWRHAESEAHRKNVLNNCPEETKTVEKKSHKKEFCQSSSLKMNNSNLEKIPNDSYNCYVLLYFYFFCISTFQCDFDALKQHSDTKKRISECQKRGFVADLNMSD